ncbi:5-oxoprolinase subunit PxpB [Idiomarina seosinensis]|uniref:Allophanate hydrolase subunit 1 n=1 Tax=Idiomarina seosinensis TaxID=281739 RepID=A0A432ZIL9_9GAMM|nr:5-oxoprolinase subunit PxpB [Idiomarina seosinensis]RUO77763.1 allophanate hydrolase subunit 1 [Idiomarina seosinensis]
MREMNDFPKLLNAGADALIVCFSESISERDNQQVIALQQSLAESDLPIFDLVPAYSSLMVYYDVTRITEQPLREALQPYIADSQLTKGQEQGQLHTIDVYYGDEVGPDLTRVMERHELSQEEVVRQHTESPFRVYALGFAPGFAYMGTLPEPLVMPRLERPRERIPAGSVAIAEQQTSIYPLQSPGGWNIIGRTAQSLYQPQNGIISSLNVGDSVQFRAISKQQFVDSGGDLEGFDD